MVRPSQERQTVALTIAQSDVAGDGTESGEDVDIDGGGTVAGGGSTPPTPPAPELLWVVDDAGDTVDIDLSIATWWDITLTEDLTITITNPPPAGTVGELHIIFRQGTGAPWTVSWPAEVGWSDAGGVEGGATPTLHTLEGGIDIILLVTEDGGASWGGTYDGAPDEVVHTVSAGAAVEIDYSVARWWDITLTANCTFTIVRPSDLGRAGVLRVILRQGTGAPWTVTWPASVVWPDANHVAGGSAPTLHTTLAAVDDIILTTFDGGVTWGGDFESAGSSSAITIKDEGSTLTAAPTSIDFVGSGVVATAVGTAVTVTVAGATATSQHILLADGHATPFAFNDLLQMDDGSDFMWNDPE